MAIPVPLLIIASVIASACTKLNAVILGKPVSISPLLLILIGLLLALAIGLLLVLRTLIRDGLRLRPMWAGEYA